MVLQIPRVLSEHCIGSLSVVVNLQHLIVMERKKEFFFFPFSCEFSNKTVEQQKIDARH